MMVQESSKPLVSGLARPRKPMQWWTDHIVVHATGIVVGVGFFLLPILYIVLVSFRSESGFLAHPFAFPSQLHFANYVAAWKGASIGKYFLNSVIYAVFSPALGVLLAVFLAFPVARGYVKGARILYQVFVYSMFLPGGLIPLFVESQFLHLYDNMIGYIILNAGAGLAFFFFVGDIKSIPKELDEAAALDGCGYTRYVFQMLIPLMKPALAVMFLLGFIGSWNNLIGPIVFLPNSALWPVTRGLFAFFGEFSTNWPLLCAALMIILAPLAALFLVLQKYLVAGVTGGSLKL